MIDDKITQEPSELRLQNTPELEIDGLGLAAFLSHTTLDDLISRVSDSTGSKLRVLAQSDLPVTQWLDLAEQGGGAVLHAMCLDTLLNSDVAGEMKDDITALNIDIPKIWTFWVNTLYHFHPNISGYVRTLAALDPEIAGSIEQINTLFAKTPDQCEWNRHFLDLMTEHSLLIIPGLEDGRYSVPEQVRSAIMENDLLPSTSADVDTISTDEHFKEIIHSISGPLGGNVVHPRIKQAYGRWVGGQFHSSFDEEN